ncbi:DNA primase [Gynurincola endophyticus]|uniref:DNA primase n=1 Tax=Gynurincola endophyticus TaxID=2479004 RepID=UPI000F8C9B62|nr:DNA primase [Gynurincola endophyticus]
MISQQTIQQILSRIDILDIVGSYVKLKKRGANYLGLCPFHNEKTPSFTVSPSKEIYKCFGCGKSGNSISFIMELEKYSYVEALKWLANKYNIEIEETYVSEEYKQIQQTADSLYILNQFAQKYFTQQLHQSEEGIDIAKSYLKERGFTDSIIDKFQLGYNLNQRDAFSKAAVQEQYNPDLLLKTGIVTNRDGHLVDNYRGRIIFPIHNQSGKILGFGARIIGKNDRAPKYINTPENEIYIKSKILYGTYFARQSIDKLDECLLVEGYTDVISLHQAGVENVVASGGTSLTTDQLRLVKKYTNNLTIIYDGDGAGIKAALRGLDLALEEGLNVKLVLIPDGEDPDSYVNKVGADAFRDFVNANKKDFIIFQLEIQLKDAQNDTHKKAQLVNQIAETIAKIDKAEDFTKQQDYIRQCSQMMGIEEEGLTNLVNKHIREKLQKQAQKQANQKGAQDAFIPPPEDDSFVLPMDESEFLLLLNKDEQNERALIRCLLEFGLKPWDESKTVAEYLLGEINDNDLVESANLKHIMEIYEHWYKEGLEPTAKNFFYHEDQSISTLVVSIMDFQHEVSAKWSEHYDGKIATREDLYPLEIKSCLTYSKLRKIRRLIEENQRDMANTTDFEQQILLLQTHQHLKQMEMDLTKLVGTVIL